ncbi:MAG: ribulose-phosphate 3-epimerase [Ignavibacteriaceae bacterium]|nr:ribulose-phosphate 3-epimerase [Ignavibacteriaceae bacterium]
MNLLAPSILSADFSNLSQQIRMVEIGGADLIHCDVMDGRFVPNLTIGPLIVEAAKRCTKLPLDVHLMIVSPDALIPEFAKAGAAYITVHQEAVPHLHRTIQLIKSLNCKAGIAINPATPVTTLLNILEDIDLVLVMSVNPGFGGQQFISASLSKIEELKNLREKFNFTYQIEIDGGVNKNTVKKIKEAGCDIFVAGSSIFHAENITAATAELKNSIR